VWVEVTNKVLDLVETVATRIHPSKTYSNPPSNGVDESISDTPEGVLSQLDRCQLPRHVAIIMDGNGRWARNRGLPRVMGHRAGTKTVRSTVVASRELGIEVVTLYAFSVENWKRTPAEVSTLMRLLNEYLNSELPTLMRHHIRLEVIGDLSGLPEDVREHLNQVIEKTRSNDKMILNLALNYGGRGEILQAARQVVKQVQDGKLNPDALDEKTFSQFLYTGSQPDPDLLIRTSGEQRLSNFMLWQISYAELYITPILWPDFDRKAYYDALLAYQHRERRFGG